MPKHFCLAPWAVGRDRTGSLGNFVLKLFRLIWNWMFPEPAQDLFGTFVGRKDGIEDVLDSATPNNHGEAL